LPGPEIMLPRLFVQICEYEKQKQGYDARNDHHTDDNAVHGAKTALAGPVVILWKIFSLFMFSQRSGSHNRALICRSYLRVKLL
jgi:hypothetical protein